MADGGSQASHPGRQAPVHTRGESPYKDSTFSQHSRTTFSLELKEKRNRKYKYSKRPLRIIQHIFLIPSSAPPPHPAHFHIPRIPHTALPPPPHHTHPHIPRIPARATPGSAALQPLQVHLKPGDPGYGKPQEGTRTAARGRNAVQVFALMRKPSKSELATLILAEFCIYATYKSQMEMI